MRTTRQQLCALKLRCNRYFFSKTNNKLKNLLSLTAAGCFFRTSRSKWRVCVSFHACFYMDMNRFVFCGKLLYACRFPMPHLFCVDIWGCLFDLCFFLQLLMLFNMLSIFLRDFSSNKNVRWFPSTVSTLTDLLQT